MAGLWSWLAGGALLIDTVIPEAFEDPHETAGQAARRIWTATILSLRSRLTEAIESVALARQEVSLARH
jgi:hypothetical protein